MPTRLWLRLAELLAALTIAVILLESWRADRRDRAQLATDLAAAKQSLAQADARQHERDAQLLQTLAGLAAEKRAVTTPAQILRDLSQQIPLPSPLVSQAATNQGASSSPSSAGSAPAGKPDASNPGEQISTAPLPNPAHNPNQAQNSPKTQIVIPAEDLKPLYDFTLDCKACQAKLAAAQADLTDERAKTSTLTNERDEAIRAAKGGSLIRRVARAAKWFAIGAAAGAIAAKSHR